MLVRLRGGSLEYIHTYVFTIQYILLAFPPVSTYLFLYFLFFYKSFDLFHICMFFSGAVCMICIVHVPSNTIRTYLPLKCAQKINNHLLNFF